MVMRKNLIPVILVSLILSGCGTTDLIKPTKLTQIESTNNTGKVIKGTVSFPKSPLVPLYKGGWGIKATLAEVGSKATVSIIYPSNHPTLANQTIATGLTDTNGNFSINPDANFNPANNDIFVLEANKRIGSGGNDLISVRTYLKWNGSVWSSITTPSININSKTTAITIIDDKDNTIAPNDTIGKIDASQQPNVVSPINTVTTQTINDVSTLVDTILTQNSDPTMLVDFQNGKYFVNRAPNPSLQVLLASKNCPNCNLRAELINNQDLSSGDLSNAKLEGASFNTSNLTGANLNGANLTNTLLNGANLTNANLTTANLTNTTITGEIGRASCRERV